MMGAQPYLDKIPHWSYSPQGIYNQNFQPYDFQVVLVSNLQGFQRKNQIPGEPKEFNSQKSPIFKEQICRQNEQMLDNDNVPQKQENCIIDPPKTKHFTYYDPNKAVLLTSSDISTYIKEKQMKRDISSLKPDQLSDDHQNNIIQLMEEVEQDSNPFIVLKAKKIKRRSRRFQLALMRQAKKNIAKRIQNSFNKLPPINFNKHKKEQLSFLPKIYHQQNNLEHIQPAQQFLQNFTKFQQQQPEKIREFFQIPKQNVSYYLPQNNSHLAMFMTQQYQYLMRNQPYGCYLNYHN